MQLTGRVALVTGGAHRVGKAIAMALASHGTRVAVHYHGAQHDAAATIAEITALGGEAHAFPSDLTLPTAPDALVTAVVRHFGALDVLVNSAAVMQRTPVDEVMVSQWDAMFALNLRAPFFLTQSARPHLAHTRGAVVNVADLAAFETWPAYVPHGITKAGVVQMTRALAHALAPEIRVNAVAPGAVLLPEGWDAEAARHLVETTPLQRLGTPADVVQAVLYLLSADYVTGETIVIDGGRRVRT